MNTGDMSGAEKEAPQRTFKEVLEALTPEQRACETLQLGGHYYLAMRKAWFRVDMIKYDSDRGYVEVRLVPV